MGCINMANELVDLDFWSRTRTWTASATGADANPYAVNDESESRSKQQIAALLLHQPILVQNEKVRERENVC